MGDYEDIASWDETVRSTFDPAVRLPDTLWPRDTLFRYLVLMSSLQENMKEQQEPQLLTACALMELLDS